MTSIQIERLRLENFKCHRNLELVLNGQNASIYGDNATGKTSVYDSLLWLLFGKDSAGNGEKNFDVKPLDSAGAVADHNAITFVEATLLVAGAPITLKRTYREIWSTKRGNSKESFDGNASEYYVDGVPCKKNAFDSRIREIVPEDTFHLLTSVSYFSRDLHWQKRRAVLFDIAGTMSDQEIMATDKRFTTLSQALGNLSLDDYRRKLAAEKKNMTGVKTDTPARISECQKTLDDLEGIDYNAVSAEICTMEQEAQQVAAQMRTVGESKTERQRTELAHLEQQISRDEAQLHSCESNIEATEQSIDNSRGRWIAVNQETFTGGTCPTCGQNLPFDQLRAATEAFEKGKQARLQEIERTAASQKAAKIQAENLAAQLRARIQQAQATATTIRKALLVAEDAPRDNELEKRLEALRRDISVKYGILGKRSVLDRAKSRIAELQESAREAARCLENVEKALFLIEEFIRYKADFLEDAVNDRFQLARFRLFREQANGGIEDRCDVMLDGVPYNGLNNSAKINVGIDIINTLSRHFGVSVPLFVDNAESVTQLEYAATQVIRLVVSVSDKELRCEYEN